MSASSEKAARRQIRRAVGVEAVNSFEQNAATLETLAGELRGFREVTHATLREHQLRADREAAARQRLEAIRDRSLWGRLSWLVRGK